MNMRVFTDLHGRGEPPLPIWASPMVDEPAHGFVLRLADLNRRSSLAVLLGSHGLNGREIVPTECLAFAHSFPIDAGALERATPRPHPDGVELLGQVVRRRHWSLDLRRFCPACLSEEVAYHRAWWDLKHVCICPYHVLLIECRDAGGLAVPWWAPRLAYSPAGRPLARYGVKRRGRPVHGLEAYVLGRMGVDAPLANAVLDGLADLGEALDLVELVGQIALGGANTSRPAGGSGLDLARVVQAGYGVLDKGIEGLDALLADVADRRAVRGRVRGRALFGWIETAVGRGATAAEALVRKAVERVAAARGSFSRATGDAWREGNEDWVSAEALARELGIDGRRVRRIAEAIGVHERTRGRGRERYRPYAREDADRIRRLVSTLLDRDGAASRLGIERATFDALAARGALSPFVRLRRPEVRDRFRPEDLDALRVPALATLPNLGGVASGQVRIGALRQTRRHDAAALILNVVDGSRRALGRIGDRLGDIVVEDPGFRGRPGRKPGAVLPPQPGIGRYELDTLFGDTGVADGLVQEGLLVQLTRGRSAFMRLEAEGARTACAEWAPARLYAPWTGRRTDTRLAAYAMERGIVCLSFLNPARDSLRAVYRRDSARTVFGLTHDPDDPRTASPAAFEARFRRALVASGDWVLNRRSDQLSLRSPSNRFVAEVVHGPAGIELSVWARSKSLGGLSTGESAGTRLPGWSNDVATWDDTCAAMLEGLTQLRAIVERKRAAAGGASTHDGDRSASADPPT